jgi:hypothetical protein
VVMQERLRASGINHGRMNENNNEKIMEILV